MTQCEWHRTLPRELPGTVVRPGPGSDVTRPAWHRVPRAARSGGVCDSVDRRRSGSGEAAARLQCPRGLLPFRLD